MTGILILTILFCSLFICDELRSLREHLRLLLLQQEGKIQVHSKDAKKDIWL